MTTGVIPDARRDDTVPPGHAGHLGEPRDRVLHEVDDELREGRVERFARERQPLGGRLPDVDARVASPRRGNERLGRIDGRHRPGPSRPTSSPVSAPVPQPTSRTRCPARIEARSAS